MSASDLNAQLQQAIALAQAGRHDEARDLLESIVAAAPGMESAWLWLASVARTPAERINALERVLALNPKNETALQAYEQLTGRTFEAPLAASVPARGPLRTSTVSGILVVLAIATVAVMVIIAFLNLRNSNNRSLNDREAREFILPTLAYTWTPRFTFTPSNTPRPTRTPGPSPTPVTLPPTWTSSPTETPVATDTRVPTWTPRPTRTQPPTAIPATPTFTPLALDTRTPDDSASEGGDDTPTRTPES